MSVGFYKQTCGEAGVGSEVGCGGAVASLGLLLNTIKVYLNKLSF